MRITAVILLAAFLTGPAQVEAQPADPRFDRLARRWAEILPAVVAEHGLRLVDASGKPVTSLAAADHVEGNAAGVRAAYRDAIDRLLAHGDVSEFYTVDTRLIGEKSRPSDQVWVEKLIEARADEKSAKSLNGTSTNPAAPRVAERSGFTDFVALALDTQNIVSTDNTAVSLSLNALAALGLDPNSVARRPRCIANTTRCAASAARSRSAPRSLKVTSPVSPDCRRPGRSSTCSRGTRRCACSATATLARRSGTI